MLRLDLPVQGVYRDAKTVCLTSLNAGDLVRVSIAGADLNVSSRVFCLGSGSYGRLGACLRNPRRSIVFALGSIASTMVF